MAHGDFQDVRPGGRMEGCACSVCSETRNFAEFRDLAEPPSRPAVITNRLEAAAFMRWLSAELVALVDRAEEAED